MPLVTRLRTSASELIRIRLSKLLAPLADGFVGYQHTTDKQQLFDIAIAEAEAVIQPDPMVNDFGGKTMVFVTLRGRWRGHAMLPRRLPSGYSPSLFHRGEYARLVKSRVGSQTS